MAKKTKPSEVDGQLSEFICFSIYATNHAMSRVYKPLLADINLTYPQYLVMVLLWNRDGRLVRELGDALFLKSNTLTPLLKRLEATGYIRRQRDSEDERRVHIYLTPRGRQLRQQAACIPERVLEATGLSERAFQDLNRKILQLHKSLVSWASRPGSDR